MRFSLKKRHPKMIRAAAGFNSHLVDIRGISCHIDCSIRRIDDG
jgi:hypothetical protein